MKHQSKTITVITLTIITLLFTFDAAAQTFNVFNDSAATQSKINNDIPESNVVNSTTYPYLTGTGGVLNTMTTGTTTLIAASQDDVASTVQNIGFSFVFDGVTYTQFSVNSNGLFKFGATAVSNTLDNESFPTGTVATDLPLLSAYWDDLCTSATGRVHFRTDGTAPNRRLTVEWLNMSRYNGNCAATQPARGTFQVQIFESRNDISFIYGAIAASTTGTGTPIGYSVLVSSATPTTTGFASVNTATNTVAYGTATNTNTAAIAAGRFYNFALPVTAANASISGRVFNQSGRPVSRAEVRFSDMNGDLRTAVTNQLGYYQFDDIEAGQTYVIQVLAKGASYAPQVVSVNDNIADLNFYAR